MDNAANKIECPHCGREIERLKREKDELKDVVEAEAGKRLNELLVAEREKIRKLEEERSVLKLAEREKVIEQLHSQLKDAQRKAEQGSSQLLGEVQESAVEEWLANAFPLDTIEEIKKGARGADCLQIVHTRTRQNCGTIYYESKRTKGFQPGWIEKFKHDIRENGADIGVLVTASMPRVWKKREKQIQKVLLNTTHRYGPIKGIAGSAIQSVPLLELPEVSDTDP